MKETRNAFIVGFPRSGTTLLAGLLNSHTKITCTPETQYYCQALKLKKFKSVEYSTVDLTEIYKTTRLKGLCYDTQKVEKIAADSESSLLIFYKNLLASYKKDNCDWIVEKTPDHARYVFRIAKDFEGAKFIFIFRDPRAAIASLLKTPWNRKSTLIAALEYTYMAKMIAKFQREFPVSIVHYEKLVSNPIASLKNVCQFLELGFESKMLENNGGKEVVPDWELAWKANSKNKITDSSLDKWRENLTRSQIYTIERSCNEAMAQNNYALSSVLSNTAKCRYRIEYFAYRTLRLFKP